LNYSTDAVVLTRTRAEYGFDPIVHQAITRASALLPKVLGDAKSNGNTLPDIFSTQLSTSAPHNLPVTDIRF